MKSESEESFVKQLKANQNIVHKICRLYTHDQDSHNDLFQEITIQLWKAYPNFRGDSKFTTWAYRVGLNTAITLYRKKKKTINTIEFDNTFHKVKQEDYNFEEEEQIKLLYSAIGELNDIVAHELEHGFQYVTEGKVYQEPPSDSLGYYTQPDEIKAQRVGLRRLAKLRKLPFNDVVRDWYETHKDIHKLTEDEMEKVMALKDLRFRMGHPSMGTSELDHFHKYIRVRNSMKQSEAELKAMER